jgi:GntR family transcriptional regulator
MAQAGQAQAGQAPAGQAPAGQAAARPLDRRSPMPLWAQLSDDLTRRLGAGGFGERFPGEHELVAEYGVSRHTVREALRRLREDGVLESARGRGTWVRQPQIDQPLGALYSLFREVESRGMEQRSEVRVRDVRTDASVAERLGLPADTALVHLERLRLADAEPLALDRAWLPRTDAEPLLEADLSHAGLYDELARHADVHLTGGRERIRAVVPDASQRRLLSLRTGVAAFAIERLGCVGETPVEWRETLVRADRFSVVAEWTQRSGYRMDVAGGSAGEPAPWGELRV